MDKEKILYFAKHNGTFHIRSCEYNGNMQVNLDYLIKNKMLVWITNELWDDYSGSRQQDLYDQAIHDYKITKDGEVLLALYRLGYAHMNHKDQDKHISRIEEFFHLLAENGRDAQYFEQFLTRNQKKALAYALKQITDVPKAAEKENQIKSTSCIENNTYDHIDLDEPVLTSMFNMSVGLGQKNSDRYRTEDYVLRKANEELGELTLEMNIADGLSYKEAGKDGVKGEAVDLAICAMDMFALQFPNTPPDVIEREFLSYMLVKLNKWRNTLK